MNKIIAGLILLIIAFAVYEQFNFSFVTGKDLRAVRQANETLQQAMMQKQAKSKRSFEGIRKVGWESNYSRDIARVEETGSLLPLPREVIAEVKNLHRAISREDGQYASTAHVLVGAWKRYRSQLNRYEGYEGEQWYKLAGAETEAKSYHAFEQPVALLRKADVCRPALLQAAALCLGWKIVRLEDETVKLHSQHIGTSFCGYRRMEHIVAESTIVEEGEEYRAALFIGSLVRYPAQVTISGREIEAIRTESGIVIPAMATDFDQNGRAVKSFKVCFNGGDTIIKTQHSFIVQMKKQ